MYEYAGRGLDPDVKKFFNFIGIIFGFGGYWLLRAMDVPIGAIFGFLIMITVTSGIGWLIGRAMSHRLDGDGPVALALAWSLVIFWVVPAIGFILASLVNQLINAASSRRYLLFALSTIGALASLINGAAGVVSAVNGG